VAIGVRETQDIIRQVVVQSKHEVAHPDRLDPQEAGMATGPRFRHRALDRLGVQPDYLLVGSHDFDPWQRLDDDIYKFLQSRKPQFGQVGQPPSYQFLAEVEVQLKKTRGDYELGSYLGLVRLAADLDQTGTTFVTASERGAMHALWRRAAFSVKPGEHYDPYRVGCFRGLLEQNDPVTLRGLADLMRLVSRAARLPLMGNVQDVPALSVTTLMQVTELAVRFNQQAQGRIAFQVSPMDVFLGARSVLFNRSVSNPTLNLLRELVLDDSGLYHDDLLEWLQSVGTFGSELTLLMPDSLCTQGYSLPGGNYSALEMVSAGGAKLVHVPAHADRTLTTLADALIFRIQKQDQHKDHQIQVLLNHFNGLLQGERRSAARVNAERKQARFDYMDAIQRASKLAQDLQTGQYAAMQPPTGSVAAQTLNSPEIPGRADPVADSLLGSLDGVESLVKPKAEEFSREVLAEWDATIQTVRRRLTAKSPVFKSMVAQIAKVRSLDTCLSYGLTPGGSRCIGRLSRIIQGEEVFGRLGLSAPIAVSVQAALGAGDAVYLSSLESLVSAVYSFRNNLENIQFRYRDRISDLAPGGSRENEPGRGEVWGDESALDDAGLGLILGLMGLEEEALSQEKSVKAGRGGTSVGDPFTAYAAFLWVCQARTGQLPGRDPVAARHFLRGLDGEVKSQWYSRRGAFRAKLGIKAAILPGLQESPLRSGWYLGCERGYMKEIKEVVERSGGDLDRQLLIYLTEVQTHLDRLSRDLEADKARGSQQRIKELLGA
jgi:hypothetical protein